MVIEKSERHTTESSKQDEIPQWIIDKWQKIINILAELLDIPAALIMKIDKPFMEVFLASHTKGNPYFPGARDRMEGLYCETVINSQQKLLVPDALADLHWNSNPDIKLGMISYLGYPINYPNHQPFGTICVLDNKANGYSATFEHLMEQFKDAIELDLKMFQEFQKQKVMFNESAHQPISSVNQVLEQVLSNKRLLVKIINSLPNIFICLIDKEMKVEFSAGHSFLEASKVKGSLVGYSIREVFGKAESILRSCLLRVSSGHSTVFETNYNNQFHHYLVMPFPTSVDPISQYLVVVEDVTDHRIAEKVIEKKNCELKLLNEEYRLAKEKAEESDQLKTRFLQNVSHEIRTPLNGIQGFSEILVDNSLTDENRKSYSDIVGSSCQQLVHIMEDIMEISQLEAQKAIAMKSRVNINDLMHDLFTSYHFIAKQKNIKLKLKPGLTGRQSIIHTDSYILHRVLSILIENALKFTFEGQIEIGYTLQDNNQIEFFVKDTGMGISPEAQRNIFERFYNAGDSATFGGLGVGLAIAKENTKLLGGDIRVVSKKGMYSHFYVAIPYTPLSPQDISNQE